MAEAYDIAVAPHCPLGPIAGLGPAAGLRHGQLLHPEQSLGIHYNQGNDLMDYLADPAVLALPGRLCIPL